MMSGKLRKQAFITLCDREDPNVMSDIPCIFREFLFMGFARGLQEG